eukprot:349929-Chlamydomonas_euryale.AAC.11
MASSFTERHIASTPCLPPPAATDHASPPVVQLCTHLDLLDILRCRTVDVVAVDACSAPDAARWHDHGHVNAVLMADHVLAHLNQMLQAVEVHIVLEEGTELGDRLVCYHAVHRRGNVRSQVCVYDWVGGCFSISHVQVHETCI